MKATHLTLAVRLVGAWLPLGCGHARETEPVAETVGHASAPHGRRGDVPLSTSPGGLLKPGGAGKIQDKLADRGLLPKAHEHGTLDGPTGEALRRFQRDHDLPATGAPDDATVRKLGLSPGDVFRSAP